MQIEKGKQKRINWLVCITVILGYWTLSNIFEAFELVVPLFSGALGIRINAVFCLAAILAILNYGWSRPIHFPHIFHTAMGLAGVCVLSTLLHIELQEDIIRTICNQIFWVCIFISTYLLARKYETKMVRDLALMICIIIIVTYILCKDRHVYGDSDGVAINSIYYLLTSIPFILCIHRKFLKAFLMVIVGVFIFISAKRTALLILFSIFVVWFFIQIFINKKISYWMIILFLLCCLLVIGFFVFYDKIVENLQLLTFLRIENLSDDLGSGRIAIYRQTWEEFCNLPWYNKFLGLGYNSLGLTSGISMAHNDLLEFLYDYGIVGTCFYIAFAAKIVKYNLWIIREKRPHAMAFTASVCIFIGLSLFSILLPYMRQFIWLVFFWAICIGENDKKINAQISEWKDKI